MIESSFISNLYQLPSVRHFLESIANDLADRKSILAVLPARISPVELCDYLRTEMAVRDLDCRDVSLVELAGQQDPVVALGNLLEAPWESDHTQRNIVNLMETNSLPEVILFNDLENLPPTKIACWMEFLTRWVEICEVRASQGKPRTSLCFVGPATNMLNCLPETRNLLTLHWWWGFPSSLETKMLCRALAWDENENALAFWRENILPGLVTCDSSLFLYLWDLLYQDNNCLIDHLRSWSKDCGWEPDVLEIWNSTRSEIASKESSPIMLLSPPREALAPWAHGALCWTPEFGLELHTAAVAELGMFDEVHHRLWRGQVGLLLPRLDRCRLFLCQHMTTKYGPSWPTRWLRPLDEVEDYAVSRNPFACQWGHLTRVLGCGYLRNRETHWLRCSQSALKIRNEIAHSRTVMFRDFELFESLANNI